MSAASANSQIAAVDGVLAHLVERVEAATVIQLSEALSTIDRAPIQTVRRLAFHEQPQVAAPVLRHSVCLSDADLLEIVKSRGQQHLLAICDRKTLNEALTDALMRFGDVNVSNALARNAGARFSECGYATLVGRAERDEGLAEKLGVRLDIPGSLLRELHWQGCRRRSRALPDGAAAGGAPESVKTPLPPDRTCARPRRSTTPRRKASVVALNRTGKLNDSIVNRFAVRGEYTHVVAALALKADVKVEAIEPLLEADRVYGLIVACKAARLTWSTTTMIVRNRPNCPPSTRPGTRTMRGDLRIPAAVGRAMDHPVGLGSNSGKEERAGGGCTGGRAGKQTPVRLTRGFASARDPPAS